VDQSIQYFWRAVGASTVPFVPIIGASGLYKAFSKAFNCITVIWALPDPQRLLLKGSTRRRFMEGGFNCTVSERIGRRFLESINIGGALTASQTAGTFLKMIVSVTLIHELLFWREWVEDGHDLPLSELDIENACLLFAKSRSQKRMMRHVDGAMTLGTWSSKKECHKICLDAVEIGRSDLYSDFTRKASCIGG
jgi:hypothetical protein